MLIAVPEKTDAKSIIQTTLKMMEQKEEVE